MRRLIAGNFVLVMALLVLSGCVTTRTGSAAMHPEPNAALRDHIQLGLGYIGEGNRKSARFHLEKAMEIDPKHPGVHNGFALLYQLELEPELAEKHFLKALSLDSGFSRARNNYGVFLYQHQRYEEAYEQFLKLSRDVGYELRAQVFVSLGTTAQRLGKTDEARDAFEKALALNPRLANVYLELAIMRFDSQDYPQARNLLGKYEALARPTAESLWLAFRLEDLFGNIDARDSKGLALKKMFPYSRENLAYQEWLKNDRE